MSVRTRDWLRTFLHLDARARKDGIPSSDVERQEATVIRALDMLDNRPGIVLADEVGMGKTYEALGVAAAMRHAKPRSRIVVVTPGPDLNQKWHEEFPRFREMFDFGDDIVATRNVAEFVQAVRRRGRRPIVLAPVTMFRSGRAYIDQVHLLSLYFYWKGFHGNTSNAILRRFREDAERLVDVRTERFLGEFNLFRLFNSGQIKRHLRTAFQRGRSGGPTGLDDLYEGGGLTAFENEVSVRNALYRARFVLTAKLMPMIDLLIVDEAHKLKKPSAITTQAMRRVFDRRFRKAVFLTATPFQLDVRELREVLSLFTRAHGAPSELGNQFDGLIKAVRKYQAQYEEFQQTWSALDSDRAVEFRWAYDRDPSVLEQTDDPVLKIVDAQVAGLKALKTETIEPGFRQWMIRSLREEKRVYRKPLLHDIRIGGAEVLPFLIYERFIAELFRRGRRTHKAAVEINMVSSYSAARRGALLSSLNGIPAEAETYWKLLREILTEMKSDTMHHPKVSDVIKDALDAAECNEKTLIFCTRVATLEHLRRELDGVWEVRVLERWRRVYPDANPTEIFDSRSDDRQRQRGRHSLLQSRFHRPQDALYLFLREPYLRTLDHDTASRGSIADWAVRRLNDVVKGANESLAEVRVGKTAAERLDYQIAKRCVEQATARLCRVNGVSGLDGCDALQNLLHPDYVQLGLDLNDDEFEDNSTGNERPRWKISRRVARMVLGSPDSLWCELSNQLNALTSNCSATYGLRVRIVEQLARYLTYKQVTFLPDLLAEANAAGLSVDSIESAGLLKYGSRFWKTNSGRLWIEKLRTFLTYFCERNSEQQVEILNGPIRTGDLTRHTADGESRQRLREAFNTPLYPMVLIANEVMQEGLDLHKHCRRIVHHDLVWNPAQIEQRVGRIDRLGSLTNRLRQHDSDATLDILYPVILGTVDERLFRTVKTREKWLEFLLGAPPDFSEYNFDDSDPAPLPDRLVADLVIDLGPRLPNSAEVPS